MKLRLIVVGRDKHDPLVKLANDYVDRIRRYHPMDVLELKEEPAKSSTPVAKVKSAEAARIEKALAPGEHVIALHERGKALSSQEVARRLERWTIEGPRNLAFVIGGPLGLDPAFLSRAHEQWTLSKMTLPHRMARAVLCEQLYRACTIVRGEPYHK